MSVEDPGTLLVRCDGEGCDAEQEMDTTEYTNGEGGFGGCFGIDIGTLEQHGWERGGDLTYCPKCVEIGNNA